MPRSSKENTDAWVETVRTQMHQMQIKVTEQRGQTGPYQSNKETNYRSDATRNTRFNNANPQKYRSQTINHAPILNQNNSRMLGKHGANYAELNPDDSDDTPSHAFHSLRRDCDLTGNYQRNVPKEEQPSYQRYNANNNGTYRNSYYYDDHVNVNNDYYHANYDSEDDYLNANQGCNYAGHDNYYHNNHDDRVNNNTDDYAINNHANENGYQYEDANYHHATHEYDRNYYDDHTQQDNGNYDHGNYDTEDHDDDENANYQDDNDQDIPSYNDENEDNSDYDDYDEGGYDDDE